jgi:hypothetical protein
MAIQCGIFADVYEYSNNEYSLLAWRLLFSTHSHTTAASKAVVYKAVASIRMKIGMFS